MFSNNFLIGLDLITLGGLLNLTVLSIVESMFIYVLLFYRGSDVFNAYRASIYLGGGGGGGGRERNKYRTLSIILKTCDKEKLPLCR